MDIYSTAIDWWGVLLILLIYGYTSFFQIRKKRPWRVALYTIVLICIFYFVGSIRYIVGPKDLEIKIGFIDESTLPIDRIISIRETINVMGAPAGSIHRLEIIMQDGTSTFVSPTKDTRDKFIMSLKKRNDQIKLLN